VLGRGTPAGVLNIGDITEEGHPEEYAIAIPWWNAWPDPKIICPGNHDIISAAPGSGDLAAWRSHFGDETQVLEAEHFRVVSTLWSASTAGATMGINAGNAVDVLGDLLRGGVAGGDGKPAVLAQHFALRGQWDQAAAPFSGAITAFGMDVCAQLIDACPNLQAFLTGHLHTWSWSQMTFNVNAGVPEIGGSQLETPPGKNSTALGAVKGKVGGRHVWSFNVSATTYVSTLGDVRSPLVAHLFTFEDDHLETRLLDCERDAWRHRYAGQNYPLIEQWRYT
jgi:hypothetical protein